VKTIEETNLPGVGIRHDFETESGERIGVITHHTGKRDLLLYDRNDPDICQSVVDLTEDEARTFGEMLGASQVTRSLNNLQQSLGGLVIDWIPIRNDWECNGHTLAEVNLSKTGVLVVAVIRNGETIPMPSADFQIFSGDTAVVVGEPDGIRQAGELMHG